MRTPLAAILGFSELMTTRAFGPLGDARYDAYCAQIHGAASFLLDLVNDIMDYAKAGSGVDAVELEDVEIGTLLGATVALFHAQAAAARVAIDLSLDPTLAVVSTDPTKLRQVLLNLVSNAVKFTPPGGRVTIAAQLAPDRRTLIVQIRDTGIGMAAADLRTALRPFGQVKAAQKNVPKGTGLGLPLAKRYVELLGGRFALDSRLGKGTTVTIALPIRPRSAQLVQL